MRSSLAALIAALVVASGCGDDEAPTAAPPATTPTAAPAEDEAPAAARPRRKGTRITLRGSEFGTMLFDARRQAIYIFERDARNRTVCYGDCAEAWPPVLTKGRPRAGKGVDRDLLGTVRRRGGARQVTYAGRPLYFYAHEGPGQVLCHNVNLNGGFWWVVGPDGRRRA
jgi:predicted lipoprotein with Yx(FWY)xxD motif